MRMKFRIFAKIMVSREGLFFNFQAQQVLLLNLNLSPYKPQLLFQSHVENFKFALASLKS
jgi:hypothetical protein